MLEELENNEKKNQTAIKEKDRIFADERNKIMKKT